MGTIGKTFALILTLIIAMSCLTLLIGQPANAQTITTPSVPQFSLVYSDTFTNIPPTTTSTTNPYNGNVTITTVPAQHIENKEINVTIVNQPFPSTVNGYKANIYYVVQTKPHFGNYWESLEQNDFTSINDTSGNIPVVYNFYLPIQSNTSTTIIQFPANYNVGDELDFQVKAVLGHYYTTIVKSRSLYAYNETYFSYQTSDWSPTQTFVMPSPTSTPSTPEFSWLIILPMFLFILSIAIVKKVKCLKH
jgi:hypothetical protein